MNAIANFFADLIDAAWDGSASGGDVLGNTGSGDYTDHVWETGVGKGLTVTPAGGDTGKILLIPNAGYRWTDGIHQHHGTYGSILSSTRSDDTDTDAWRLWFNDNDTSGRMYSQSVLYSKSLRCVRS